MQANKTRQESVDLFEEQEELIESLTSAMNASSLKLEEGRKRQAVTDDLLAAVNKSRSLADEAIEDAERTLSEAEQTLTTLRGECSYSPDLSLCNCNLSLHLLRSSVDQLVV